jgi:hypothetical protein
MVPKYVNIVAGWDSERWHPQRDRIPQKKGRSHPPFSDWHTHHFTLLASFISPHRTCTHTLTHRHHKATADIINRSDRRIMMRYAFITLHYHYFRLICLFLFLCLLALPVCCVQRRSDVAPTSRAEAARLGLGGHTWHERVYTWVYRPLNGRKCRPGVMGTSIPALPRQKSSGKCRDLQTG